MHKYKSADGVLSVVHNMDCMELMKEKPDGWYDLAVVDPEYGIDAGNMTMGSGKNKKYDKKNWDKNIPNEKYFKELFRVSKNQIICGGNYFTEHLKPTKGWIFWDKGINGDCSFADGELIWTSYDTVLRKSYIRYKGFLGADKERIHITQKPIALYDWIYSNYLPNGGKVLDTHLGSQSNRISAFKRKNIIFESTELDIDYYNDGNARFDSFVAKYEPATHIPTDSNGQNKLF